MTPLNGLLRRLDPTGWNGLEGLAAALLADALNLEARLAASGSQNGRDVGLFGSDGKRRPIDIEAKRYGAKAPDRSALLGKLTEARRARPDTEVWYLVSTHPIPPDTVEALDQEAFDHGFDVVVLDSGGGGLGSLDLLVASRAEIVERWLQDHAIADRDAWGPAMEAVRTQPAYDLMLADLPQRLASRYAAHRARQEAQAWLATHVRGRRRRIEGLNQSLGRTGRAPAVPRPRLEARWRPWLAERSDETRVLALLGGEGDGKTWTAIDILRADPSRTPLIATSNMLDDGGPASVLAKALAQQCGGDSDRWRDRLEARRPFPSDFRPLLLLDGLNESRRIDASALIDDLLVDNPWGGALDLVVTCREPYWDHRIADYLAPHQDRLETLAVGPFDPADEWPIAQAHLGPAADNLEAEMQEALRNPRLWSFAYELRDRLGGLGEITLERLLVEHWRLRVAERDDIQVDPPAFNRLISRAADDLLEKTRTGGASRSLEQGDLQAWLSQMSGNQDYTKTIAEIRDGVFFKSGTDFRLLLRTERVPVALGLLLAERVVGAFDGGGAPAALRAAGTFLDDLPASDRVEIIVRAAVFSVLALPSASPKLLAPLLRHWIGLQNFEGDLYRALAIVAAAAPEACLQAIEDEASEDEFVGTANADLSAALKGRSDRPQVEAALAAAARRWLRSYSADHFSRIAGLGLEGLEPSSIVWVETLDDFAAGFLASLAVRHWPPALGYWARRRLALLEINEDVYLYDDHLSYLGLMAGITDAGAAAIEDQIASADDPKLSSEERRAVAALLHGEIFDERSRRYAQELTARRAQEVTEDAQLWLRDEASEAGFEYPRLYVDDGADGTEQWLQHESVILEAAPGRLAPIVERLARQAREAVKAGEPGGLAQFARDHALLLGDQAIELIHRYAEQKGKDGRPGRACAALFAATGPDRHLAVLATTPDLAGLKRLDTTGLARPPAVIAIPFIKAGVDTPANALTLALALAAGQTPLETHETEALSSFIRHPNGAVRAAALRALRDRGDVEHARIATERFDTIVSCRGRTVADVSALILLAQAQPSYADLRGRLRPADWVAAASADGSEPAVRQCVADLDGLIQTVLVQSWPIPAPPDFKTLAAYGGETARAPGVKVGEELLMLDVPDAQRVLDFLADRAPEDFERWRSAFEGLAAGDIATLENRTGLISGFALRSTPEAAAVWIDWLLNADHARSDYKGLLVERGKRLLFERDEPAIIAARDELADAAWSDDDILQLVCLAELDGRHDWLNAWIEREAAHEERCRRVRSLVLRGWRASAADRAWLADPHPSTGYETFALDIARVRAERRLLLKDQMSAYADAPSEADAWLALRRMAHLLDRRMIVDLRRFGWPDALPPQRKAAFEHMTADFERLFRRQEGDLRRTFAGVVAPPSIRPWGEVIIYSSGA